MSFLVTARKWRPLVFEDVVGQAHISTTLRNAIATNRLSHAYIFSGARGCGKTTTARILAKAINCLHPKDQNPDNDCELCREITDNRSLNVFEIDGASNRGVDEIRNLREAVRYGPAKGKYKVYIIDEVHMLTKEAFNALLKTLEEPPPYIMFIFATTEIHKVPLTILSRCQRFDFRRIAIEDIISRLQFIATQEHISIDNDALLLIAKRADGSMRDAQSMFDQVVSFCGNRVASKQIVEMWNIIDEEFFFRTTNLISAKDVKGSLLLTQEILDAGMDYREFLNGLTEHFRNILVARITGSAKLIETSETYKKRYIECSAIFSENDLLRLIKIASDTASAIRWSQQPHLNLEIGVMQMVKMDSSIQLSQLLSDLDELKKKDVRDEDTSRSTRQRENDKHSPEASLSRSFATITSASRQERPNTSHTPAAEPLALYASEAKPRSTTIPLAVSSKQEPIVTRLSIDEALGKWTSFVDAARKERIAVGSMLSETRLVDIQADRLRIGCPDDFHMDALKRNRQFLTELAQRVYGAKVVLETLLAKNQPAQHPLNQSPVSNDTPTTSTDIQQHPVVLALIKEFNTVTVE